MKRVTIVRAPQMLEIVVGDAQTGHDHPAFNLSIASLSDTTSAIFAFMSKMFASCTAGDRSPQASLTTCILLVTSTTTHGAPSGLTIGLYP
jgi:hypothetical protein